MHVLFNTGLHCITGCGISVTDHITGGECCLHCSCVSLWECWKENTSAQKSKHNHWLSHNMYNLVTILCWQGFLQYLRFMTSLLYQSEMCTSTCGILKTNNALILLTVITEMKELRWGIIERMPHVISQYSLMMGLNMGMSINYEVCSSEEKITGNFLSTFL